MQDATACSRSGRMRRWKEWNSSEPTLARAVAVRSMSAVEAGDRDGWLGLFVADAVVEDPIGPSPMNPSGEPRRGIDAIVEFYDNVIAMGECGSRSGSRTRRATNVPTSGRSPSVPRRVEVAVEGVYTYRSDGNGRLVALRAYWEFDSMTVRTGWVTRRSRPR